VTRRTCGACDNPAPDGVVICARCERITSHNLGDMEAHRQQLEVTLTRQARLTAATEGSRSANTPLVYQELASELLGAQRATLASWCRLLHDEVTDDWPRRDTVMSMALHIEAHLTELRKHDAAGELVDEIRQLVTRIGRCIDYPEDQMRTVIGVCPTVYEDETRCAGQVVLHQPRMFADCRACGKVWESKQLAALGRHILNRDAYGTVGEIAGMYGIPDGTIRRWVSEGKLEPMPDGTIRLAQFDKVVSALGRDRVA
jgi:uncharacterized Zn finger protein (UPF0148 family)